MRVIGGSLKGRRYQPHKRFTERPTTDFARESLFNVLQHRVDFDGLHAVDLFAGTGAIGYELASRGAASVVSVEKQFANVRAIKKQLAEFDLDQVQVLCADVFDWLSKTTIAADLVFADPPYAHPQLAELPARVWASSLLEPGGQLVLEHGQDHRFEGIPGFDQTRKYGGVYFSFFSKPEA